MMVDPIVKDAAVAAMFDMRERHDWQLEEWADAFDAYRDALEAEVERLHKHGSDLNSELLGVRIKHVGEKDELRREVERLTEEVRLAKYALDVERAEVERLEEERSGLQYTVKGLIAANQQMADRIKDLKADVERLRDYDERLTAIMPPDYKDWHQNSRQEWPEVAVATILSLRESEMFFMKAFTTADDEFKTVKAEVERLREAVREIAKLDPPVPGTEYKAVRLARAALAWEE